MSANLITQLERYGEHFVSDVEALETPEVLQAVAVGNGKVVVGPQRRAWAVMAGAFVVTLAVIGGLTLLIGDEATSVAPAGEPGSVVVYGSSEGIGDGCAAAFAVGSDTLWTAGPCGLYRFEGTQWILAADLPEDVDVYRLTVAPNGSVWVGTSSGGVVHYDGNTTIQFDLVAPFVAVAADGTVWVRPMDSDPAQQLLRLDGDEWVPVVEAGAVGEVVVGGDGAVWVSADEEPESTEVRRSHLVLRRLDGIWTTYPVPEDIEPGWLKPAPGGVALGIDAIFDGVDWVRIEATPIPSLGDFGIEPVAPPGEDDGDLIDSWEWADEVIAPNGDLWVTSGYYGALRHDGTAWRHYSTDDGLASNRLTFVAIGPDGSVWLGSDESGLSRVLPEV